ncbi:MAG: fused MFS/spermidine synthase [Desulforhopalus sp.]|nr:fused MFS/spermidine synthase [Desulforhopalus sp.]
MSSAPGFSVYKKKVNGYLVEILDNGDHRSLYFASEHLQSRMSLSSPQTLILPYTQYMAASLLLQPDPRDILIVGIGAGSLVRFYSHHFPGCYIDGVDSSPHILALAQGYFRLRESEQIVLHCQDGLEFLQDTVNKSYDLILVDAFDDQGMAPTIYSAQFFAACSARLKNGGVMSCNLWSSDAPRYRDIKALIAGHFADALYLPVPQRGNIVALAMTGPIPWRLLARKDKDLNKLASRYQIDFKEVAGVARANNLSLSQRLLAFWRDAAGGR